MIPLSHVLHLRWDQMSALEQRLDLGKQEREPENPVYDEPLLLRLLKNPPVFLTATEPEPVLIFPKAEQGNRRELKIWINYLQRIPLKVIAKHWNISTAAIYKIKYQHIPAHRMYLEKHEDVRQQLLYEALRKL